MQEQRSHRLELLPAFAAGVSGIAMAIYQVATPGSPSGATYDTLLDWVRELLFVAFLASSAAGVAVAVRRDLAPKAAVLAGGGYTAILVGVLYGMVTREDPDWFFVLAGPGNLLAVAGFVTWALWGARTRALPVWAALMCGVGGTVAVLGAEFGTSVVIAGFWLYLAARSHQTKS